MGHFELSPWVAAPPAAVARASRLSHVVGMTDQPKRPRDANQLAKLIVDLATGEASEATTKSPGRAKRERQGPQELVAGPKSRQEST